MDDILVYKGQRSEDMQGKQGNRSYPSRRTENPNKIKGIRWTRKSAQEI